MDAAWYGDVISRAFSPGHRMSTNAEGIAPGHPTIQFIEFLRAMACLMVVYCHVIGRPPIVLGQQWAPDMLMAHYVTGPLGIIQNFGFLGVAVFFLISGFIVTHTALLETRFSFLIKRIFRIYPALFVAVVGTVYLSRFAQTLGMSDPAIGIGHTNALLALFGFEAGFTPTVVLGVSWTISIELAFYATLLVVLPVLKRSPIGCMSVLLAICGIGSYGYAYTGGAVPHVVSHWFAFMPIFVVGMSIYFFWSQRVGL